MGWALGLGFLSLFVSRVLRRGPTDFDDAFMFVRYARNIADGYGMVWNRGDPPVGGVTSPLHLILVTGAGTVLGWGNPARPIQLVSLLALVLTVVCLGILAARAATVVWLKHPGIWIGGLAALLLASDALHFHAWTGMDTAVAMLAHSLLAGALLKRAHSDSKAASVMAVAAAYLAWLARPDSLAAGLPGLIMAAWFSSRSRLARFSPVAAFVALIAVDLALRKHFLGTALPLSFYVKQPGHMGGWENERGWNPFWFLQVFLMSAAPFLWISLATFRRESIRPTLTLLLPTVIFCGALFWPRHVMGHQGRLFFPILPFIVLAAARALDAEIAARAAAAVQGSLRPRPLGLRAAFSAGLLLLLYGGLGWGGEIFAQRRSDKPTPATDPQHAGLDSWTASHAMAAIAKAAPAGTTMAMSEHGLVSAHAPHVRIIDLLGLHDPDFAFGVFSADRLFAKQPDLIWLPHEDYPDRIAAITGHPAFQRDFDYFPGALYFGVAIRKGDTMSMVRAGLQAVLAAPDTH